MPPHAETDDPLQVGKGVALVHVHEPAEEGHGAVLGPLLPGLSLTMMTTVSRVSRRPCSATREARAVPRSVPFPQTRLPSTT